MKNGAGLGMAPAVYHFARMDIVVNEVQISDASL